MPVKKGQKVTKKSKSKKDLLTCLKQENANLKRALEAAIAAIVVLDKKGNIIFVNKAFSNLLGFKQEILIKMSFFDLVKDNKEKKQVEEYIKKIKNKKKILGNIGLKHKKGNLIYLWVRISKSKDIKGNITGFVFAGHDISKEREYGQKVKELEQRWKFALEGGGNGVWDWDITTGKVFFSKQWKAMLGYGEKDFTGNIKEWENIVHPEDMKKSRKDLQDHFEGKKEYYENEQRVKCKNGKYKWILDRGKVMEWSDEGKPLRMVGTHTDISDIKKNKEDIENKIFQIERMNKLMLGRELKMVELKKKIKDLEKKLK